MPKVTLTAQLNKQLLDRAQPLIAAGQFKNMDELLDEALRTFLLNYQTAQQPAEASLAARVVQGLMADVSPLEREQFEEFVAAYVGLAQHSLDDDGILNLLEVFKAYGFKRALAAVHDAQDSKVPLTPRYLETILERSAAERESHKVPTVMSEVTAPPRVQIGSDNPLLAAVAKMYEQEIGGLTEKVCEQLKELVGEYPELERWHAAFEAAATMNKRSLRYVVGCLKGDAARRDSPKTDEKEKTRLSNRERHRSEKAKRIQNYEDYWNEDFKANKKGQSSSS